MRRRRAPRPPRPRRGPRRRLTLRARLGLWYGGAVALTGLVLVTITTVAAVSAAMSPPVNSPDDLREIEIAVGTVGPDVGEEPAPGDPGATPTPGASSSFDVHLGDPTVEGLGETDVVGLDETAIEELHRALNMEIPDSMLDAMRAAVARENARIQQEVIRSVLTWSAAALVLTAVIAVIVGRVIATRALDPLRRMTATAHRVAGDNLGERIAMDGPEDEVKDLADTFDAMLERLDRSFDAQRRFVANASHELRTPLTINRTVLEVALADPDASSDLREVGDALLDVNARHERLIEGLLTLAATEQTPTTEDVDVTELVRIAASRAAGSASVVGPVGADAAASDRRSSNGVGVSAGEDASPALRLEVAEVHVIGNGLLLERLIQNLVDNAFRYNVPGGFVDIQLATENGVSGVAVGRARIESAAGERAGSAAGEDAEPVGAPNQDSGTLGGAPDADHDVGRIRAGGTTGSHLILVVENSGPQVPADTAESLFEPFRRLDRRGRSSDRNAGYVRGGLGLGLSIVRSVAQAHAGTATAESREGGGLTVRVRLPLDGPGPAVEEVPSVDATR